MESSSIVKESLISHKVVRQFLHEGPERARSPKRPLHEAMKVKPELHWNLRMLEASEPCATCQGKLHTRNGIKVCCSQQIQKSNYKPFDIDMELQDL